MHSSLRSALVICLCLLAAVAGFASNPSSVTINTPPDTTPGVKQSLTYTGGPISMGLVGDVIVANTASFTCKRVNPPTACDWFDIYMNVPSSLYTANTIGLLKISITWQLATGVGDPAVTDLDMYIIKCATSATGAEDCSTVGNMAQSTDSNQPVLGNDTAAERVALFDPPGPAHYRVLVVGSIVTVPVNYTANVTYSIVSPPTPPANTSAIFQNFVSPLCDPANAATTCAADGVSRMGTPAAGGEGEPSIGVNLRTGHAMAQSGLETLRLSFNDSIYPSTATWADVGSTITSTISLDPILWTDPRTNRTFVSQLMAACSLMAFTDDDGVTWTQNPVGCGLAAAIDHQTVGGGPFAPPLTSTDVTGNPPYPDSVVYCAQASVSAQCAMSTNGGLVFGPGFSTYNLTQCGGLHGHVRSGPDGTLYLPNANCFNATGSGPGVAISHDNGITWTVSTVPGGSVNPFNGTSDPWVDVAADGTVYLGYADGDGHARIAVSHDQGQTWPIVRDAGAQVGVVNSEFAAVVVGDPNRAAFAFIGTNKSGDTQASDFAGVWYLYVSFTYDGGNTWTTYNATPNDPVQRGCVWNQGGGNPCRNLLDFNGIALDKVGRVLVVYTDGCIDDPQDPTVRCASGLDYSKSVLTTIARQSAGIGLYGAFDGQIFKTAPSAPTLSGIAGNMVNHLTWTDGSNDNSPLTAIYVYRGSASGAETLYATLSGSATSYDDTAVVNGTTYYYQVSEQNAVGGSPRSNELALTPQFAAAPSAPRNLRAMGKNAGVMLVWGTPSSSGTAPITAYRVYRGTAPGTETFLATAGNKNNFVDNTAASGTTYYYVVTAVNSVGESAKSNEASTTAK